MAARKTPRKSTTTTTTKATQNGAVTHENADDARVARVVAKALAEHEIGHRSIVVDVDISEAVTTRLVQHGLNVVRVDPYPLSAVLMHWAPKTQDLGDDDGEHEQDPPVHP